MTEVSIIRLTRRLTAKQKFLKRMTGNRNANEKNKLTKGNATSKHDSEENHQQ